MNKKLFIILLNFFSISLNCQVPSNDAAWILQTSASEEFNSSLDTINKWHPRYSWGNLNNGAEYNYPSNLVQTGTTLKIKADTLVPGVHVAPSLRANTPSVGVTYAYQGGAITTRQDLYKFGYLEVNAKFPSSYWPLWPAAWTLGCGGTDYNEIDYAENSAPNSYNGYLMGTNVWVHIGACTQTANDDNPDDMVNLPLISGSFHKFATEWSPDRISFYFDDALIRTHYDPSGTTIPQHPMAAILNFCVDPHYSLLPTDWNNTSKFPNYPAHGDRTPTNWPQYLEIDYMRYYKLSANCNNNLIICNPSVDYSSRAVQKSIVTGGSCTPTFDTSAGFTLRATDYVLIDTGTTINANGSGYFSVITVACPQ